MRSEEFYRQRLKDLRFSILNFQLLFIWLSHVVEHVLYVFVFFNAFDECVNGSHLLFVESFCVVRYTNEFRRCDFVAVVFEIFLDSRVLSEFAIDYDIFVVFNDFVNTIVDKFEFEAFEVKTFLFSNVEYTFVIEKEFKRTRSTERTTKFVEIATYVGNSTSSVVGSSLNEDSDTVRAVAFVVHLFVVGIVFR